MGRPRLRWEDNNRKGLLVATECKRLEENSWGQGTAVKARARCGLRHYWWRMKEEEKEEEEEEEKKKKTMTMMMMMVIMKINNLTSHWQHIHQMGNIYIKEQHIRLFWRQPLRLPVPYIRANIGFVSEWLNYLCNISEHGYVKFFKRASREGIYLCICMEVYFPKRLYLYSLSAEKLHELFSLNSLYNLATLYPAWFLNSNLTL